MRFFEEPQQQASPDQRNLDFSIPAARAWYVEQQAHYIDAGVDFFWNDEGETDWYVRRCLILPSLVTPRYTIEVPRWYDNFTLKYGYYTFTLKYDTSTNIHSH